MIFPAISTRFGGIHPFVKPDGKWFTKEEAQTEGAEAFAQAKKTFAVQGAVVFEVPPTATQLEDTVYIAVSGPELREHEVKSWDRFTKVPLEMHHKQTDAALWRLANHEEAKPYTLALHA